MKKFIIACLMSVGLITLVGCGRCDKPMKREVREPKIEQRVAQQPAPQVVVHYFILVPMNGIPENGMGFDPRYIPNQMKGNPMNGNFKAPGGKKHEKMNDEKHQNDQRPPKPPVEKPNESGNVQNPPPPPVE